MGDGPDELYHVRWTGCAQGDGVGGGCRGRPGGQIRQLGVFENRPEVLSKLAARLSNKNCRVSFCYEAGPCGYGLQRLLTSYGHDCVVVAPSLIPMKAGDRVQDRSPRRPDAGQAAPRR